LTDRRPPRDDDAAPLVYGVHPVLETLERRPGEVERVLVAREGGGARLGRLLRAAREAGVPVTHVPREVLARRTGRGATHQGVAAVVAPLPYAEFGALRGELLRRAHALVVVLDGIEDPRNLGAVLRSAAAAGADAVFLGAEGTVGVTAASVKASAGTAGRVPVARVARVPAFLGDLADAGYRVVALDPRGPTPWHRADLSGRVAVVAGGEGRGLRPGVLGRCRDRVSIPLAAGVESLNVSVAVGIVLFEAVRQRASPAGGDLPDFSVGRS